MFFSYIVWIDIYGVTNKGKCLNGEPELKITSVAWIPWVARHLNIKRDGLVTTWLVIVSLGGRCMRVRPSCQIKVY